MDNSFIVTKSNKLITCNHKLSLQEQKIILTLASMVQPSDTDFKEYEFKISEFMKLLGVDTKTKYKEVPKITKELMQKVFEIREGKEILQLSWLSSARYKIGEGTVVLKFDSNLKPYLLGLKEFYTSYKLDNVLSLKSKYSIRIYEILKSNLYKKSIDIELEELKKMTGAIENTYNTYANFKNRIIVKAQQELCEKTDICFNFEELKTGRKVTSLKFMIYSNTENQKYKTKMKKAQFVDQEAEEELAATVSHIGIGEEFLINQVKIIIEEDLSDKDILKILDKANSSIVTIQEKYSLAKESTTPIKNLTAWMIDAIKNDYPSPVKGNLNSIKTQTYPQGSKRQYDVGELENILLNRGNDN